MTGSEHQVSEQGRSRSYPEGNPFPAQGSVTVDSPAAQPGAGATPVPTMRWGPVDDLTRLAREYLEGYQPSTRDAGFPVVLCGEHGSGKTHTIRHVMSLVTSGELQPRSGALPCFQIYARAENADFMELYRQLMKQVPLAVLRDMTLRFLGVVSSELFGEALKSDEARDRAAKIVQADPEVVRRAFEQQLVGEDEAKGQQAKEVQETFGKQENFHNVLTYLLRDDLAATARAWLVGEEVSGDDVKKLGVTAPIRTPAVARWGLRFLATLFGRGGRPLVVYIDQYEKLVMDPEKVLHEENVGLLRSLVDEIAKESGMMVLGGNQQAWEALAAAPDLRQRFGKKVITFPQLTPQQAEELVRLYLTLGRYEVVDAWTLDNPAETLFTLRGHALPIRSIALTPDGRHVISASKDSTIKVWDVKQRALARTLLQHRDAVNAVAVSSDGHMLASASDDRTVLLWDLKSGARVREFDGHQSWVNGVAFSPDGRWLVSASSDTTIRIWNRSTGKCERPLEGHTDTVWSVAVTPKSDRIVSGSSDGTVRLWDLLTGEPIAVLRGHRSWVNTVVVSPDGRLAASASDDQTVRVWDLDQKAASWVFSEHKDAVRGVAWLPDGTLLSAGIDDAYVRWNVETGQSIASCVRPAGNVIAFAVRAESKITVFSGVGELRKQSSSASPGSQQPSPDELYPFEEEAIRVILASGGGNLRRLVQDCSEVFGRALPKRLLIDAAFVKDTLSNRTSGYLDRAGVLRRIEKMMAERALNFKRGFKVNSAVADLAVLGADGVPRMLIQVSEPLFHADEAKKAQSGVGLVDQARNLPASVIIVVAGYASPEVIALLARAAHDVIVFDPERFDRELAGLLDRLRENLAKESAPPDLSALRGDLDSVKAALQQIASVRSQETVNLDAQLRRLLEVQSTGRTDRQQDDLRVGWAQERRQLEERIRDVRKAARKDEFDEIETLRARADEALFAGVRWFAVGAVIVVVGAMMWGVTTTPFDVTLERQWLEALRSSLQWGAGALALVLLFAGSFAIAGPATRLRFLFGQLAAAVTSFEELDRLAFHFRERASDSWLRHPNPHLRYARALVVRSSKSLTYALNAEPSRIVRRAMARSLGQCFGNELDYVFREVSWRRTAEVGYTVEAAASRQNLMNHHLQQLPGGLRALAIIVDRERPGLAPYGSLLTDALEERELSGYPAATGRVPEQILREALRDLSPFDEPGIGTLSELDCIDRVDQCFIYLSQLRFYQEHGAM